MTSFEHRFRVRFQDLDPAGILFFARLFDHAHDAYAALLSEAGYSLKSVLEAGHIRIPLVHAEADYRQPLRLDDLIVVKTSATHYGKTSLRIDYQFLRDEICCATATTTHVFTDARTLQPVPVPQALRRCLGLP